MAWVYLVVAILLEVVGTVFMKISEGFTKMVPSVFMFVFYIFSLASLTMALKTIPVSLAYALWAGIGTATIAMIGFIFFKEMVTPLRVIALLLIVLGVVLLNIADGATNPS